MTPFERRQRINECNRIKRMILWVEDAISFSRPSERKEERLNQLVNACYAEMKRLEEELWP